MAQRSATVSRAAAGAKTRARKIVGPKAIGRLEKSLDAAEIALKDLRKELGRGGSTAVKDLDSALKNSRKSFTSTRKTILADIEKLQKAATKGTPPKRTGGRPATRAAAAKPSKARASAAGKKGAAKSPASGTRAKKATTTSRSRSTGSGTRARSTSRSRSK